MEITESYDLFILVLREQNFELYQIDLDIFNGKKERKVENQQK